MSLVVHWQPQDYPVFPISEGPLRLSLREAGTRMLDRVGETDIVIASHVRRFDYCKPQVAFDNLWFHKASSRTRRKAGCLLESVKHPQ